MIQTIEKIVNKINYRLAQLLKYFFYDINFFFSDSDLNIDELSEFLKENRIDITPDLYTVHNIGGTKR